MYCGCTEARSSLRSSLGTVEGGLSIGIFSSSSLRLRSRPAEKIICQPSIQRMDQPDVSTWNYARWVFVVNNPGDWRPKWDANAAYLVYQLERGEEQGTTHLQGYVRFAKRKRFKTAKSWFSNDAVHIEKAQGNEQQNRDYCTKEQTRVDGPWEFGTFVPRQGMAGRRSDLEDIAEKIVSKGATAKQIATEHPGDFIRYHQGIYALLQEAQPLPPMEREIKVLVLWGPTGTGKTHRIRHACPDIYDVKPGRDPWGAYAGEEAILFDEFDYTRWPITDMNRYLDKWRCMLDARYRDKYARWTRVAICANSSPESWYTEERWPLVQAFRRRIETVINVISKEQEINIVT